MSTIDTPTRIYYSLGALRGCLESAEATFAGLPEKLPVSGAAAEAIGEAARSARAMVNAFARFSDIVQTEGGDT